METCNSENILSFVKQYYNKYSNEYQIIKDNIDKYGFNFCTSEINDYFNEIKDIPRLSLSEQEKVLKEYINGSEKAKQILITSNLYYVFLVALGYIGNGINLEDIIQEGNIGLIAAVNSINESNKNRYVAQINCYVNHYIKNFINKIDKNKPAKKIITSRQAAKIIDYYTNQFDFIPSIEEICNEFEKTNNEFENAEKDNISLELNLNNDDILKDIIYNTINNPETIYINGQNELLPIIQNSNLTEKQKKYILVRFGILDNKPKSANETATLFHISPEAIRCTHNSAIKRLKLNNQIVELYGEYYNNPEKYELLKKEIEKNKMNRKQMYLASKKQLWIYIKKNIYYLFPNSSKNKIDMAFNTLSKEEMTMLEKIFKDKTNNSKEELLNILNKLSFALNGVNYLKINQEKKVDMILCKNNKITYANEKANIICNTIRILENLNNIKSDQSSTKKYSINIKCKVEKDNLTNTYYKYNIIISEKDKTNINIITCVQFDLNNQQDGLKIITNIIHKINENANKINTTFDIHGNSIIQNNSNIKIVTQINDEIENERFIELHRSLKDKHNKYKVKRIDKK